MSNVVPDRWSNGGFDRFLTLQRGHDLPTQNRVQGDVPIFGSNGIVGSHNESVIPEDGVVTGRSGSIGDVHFTEGKYWALNTTLYVKDFHGNSKKYIYYFLSDFSLERFSTGTSVPTLNRNDVHIQKITIPPLPEQKKIASILTSVDEVIENTQKQIDKLQDLKKATMNELLTKGIGHAEFKDSELGQIPVSWEVKELGKLAKFNSGYAFKNGELSDSGMKVVRISNLHKPNFPYWHYSNVIKDTWIVEPGDILFSWAGVANSINVHKYNGERALINQHIYNFIFESDEIKEWTYYVLKHLLPKLKESIEGGAGQLHLTKPFIQAIQIIFPSRADRENILSVFKSLDERIFSIEKKLGQTRLLKKSLMQDLLTGKVRVRVN